MKGKFYGVGVGPGDPGMLTLKAVRVLEKVDVICAPVSKAGRESSALKVVKDKGLAEDKRVMRLVFPMTRDERVLQEYWRKAGRRIRRQLEKGRDVAFITLGDPTFYSTYLYVLEELRGEEVEVETIPGVTSVSACLAAGNLALARGDEKVAVLPASQARGKLEALLREFDSIVLLKSKDLRGIAEELKTLGAEEDAWVFARCGSRDFVSHRLSALKGKEGEYFSMVLIRRRR
jgi:precorrin-2/cobalt-factor-2 C20-methyltransferase